MKGKNKKGLGQSVRAWKHKKKSLVKKSKSKSNDVSYNTLDFCISCDILMSNSKCPKCGSLNFYRKKRNR